MIRNVGEGGELFDRANVTSFGDEGSFVFQYLTLRAGTARRQHRYTVFRRVLKYYSDDPMGGKAGEDAFDMRKPLKRDKKLQHIRANGEDFVIYPEDLYHG